MKCLVSAVAATIILLPSTAAAWDFGGRVRGPDFLDPYLYFFGFLTAVTFLAVMVTKPATVPMSELYRAQLPRLCKIYHRLFCLVAVPFLGILLIGPGILIYERDFAPRDSADIAAEPRSPLATQINGVLAARPAQQTTTRTHGISRTGAGGAKFVTVRTSD